VAVDGSGNLLIADQFNNRIREVLLGGVPTLALTNLNPNNAGTYSVLVSSPYGSVTSSIVTLSVVYPASITTQPSNVTMNVGDSTNFSLTAAGTAPLAYQWYFTSTAVDVGTNAFLPINNVTPGQAGNYFCIVTNAYAGVTSSVAMVNVQLPPITPAFTSSNGTFNFTWGAVSNLTYQLQYNLDLTTTNWVNLGSPITATNSSVSTTDILGSDAQRFYRVLLVQ